MRMRIFEVGTELRGLTNYASYKVLARTAEEAVKKVKKEFLSGERVESIQPLATADYGY